ncbi:uncharacterized protein [Chelonus insularis]|uniref:uncharacterized protein n=1 Tax=Chelonus insularis TaxID=460826 RepID=UPI001588A49B|nr:uncharacterized protein LOC118071357 [Chelonus insularis]
MSKKRKLIDIKDICRFCLSDDNAMVDITAPYIQKKVEAFSASTSIIIEDTDYLPKKICHVCVYKLESWYDFKQQLKRSYSILLNYLKTGEFTRDITKINPNVTNVSSTIDKNSVDGVIKNDPTKMNKLLLELNVKKEKEDDSLSYVDDQLNTSLPLLEKSLESLELLTPKVESTSEGKTPMSPVRNRLSSVRRTSEQRLASTQRWVARKRALLAATGQNESDTDSMGSDTTQLSPMKKARVKCNERELERKRNEQDMMNECNQDELFKPQTIQSEVRIGDTTFVVTSTLYLSEPQFLSQSFNNLKGQNNDDVDQNMDIIDALQLRRVNDNKQVIDKMLEKCLNIEVEGTELEALQKVQVELASFVETEIKNKLTDDKKDQSEVSIEPPKPQDSFQTLEQQLKIIVEKTIKKNLENYRTRRQAMNKLNRTSYPVPSTFVKAAVKSPIFQPKVVVDRLDPKILQDFVKSKPENDPMDVKENLENCQDLVVPEKHVCTSCGLVFGSKAELTEHRLAHIGVKRRLMRCKRCHTIVEHELVKFHVCKIKSRQYPVKNQPSNTEVNSVNHQVHQNEEVKKMSTVDTNVIKEVNCFICEKAFSNAEKLKDHLQSHCDDNDESSSNIKEIFQCAICGMTVDTGEKLESHVEQHLFNDADDNPDLIDVVVDMKKPELHSCVQCNQKFHSEINLALHMQAHEEETAIAEWEDEYKMQGIYGCTICYDTFENEQQLADHFDVHNCSSHICVLCDKPFLTLAELQEHVNTH